jgi:hypothetical protein
VGADGVVKILMKKLHKPTRCTQPVAAGTEVSGGRR